MTIGFPDAIHHVALTVSDLAASRAWYRRLLGADPVVDEEVRALPGHHQGFHRTAFALTGGGILALHAHPGSGRAARLEEHRPGLEHVGFVCRDRGDLERLRVHLDELGVPHGGKAGGHGLAFRDPDGIALEVRAPKSWARSRLWDASGRGAAGGGRRARMTPWVGPARWSKPSRWSRWSGPSERHRRSP
jgi:glyoxylase I family protein